MKKLLKKTVRKETKFSAFLQMSNDNLNAIRGGEDPPPDDDNFPPPGYPDKLKK